METPSKPLSTENKRLLVGITLCVALGVVLASALVVQPFRSQTVKPLALNSLPVYPNALNPSKSPEGNDLYDTRIRGKDGPDPLNSLTFTTGDQPTAVLDFYTARLQNEGWELLVYTGGPKLYEYVPAPPDRWRRFRWPIANQGNRDKPFYLLDVMAYPSEEADEPENTQGKTFVSVAVENGPMVWP